jgi:hypothetical protein
MPILTDKVRWKFRYKRENSFVGRFPRVVRSSQPQANFRYAFSVFEFASIRVKVFALKEKAGTFQSRPLIKKTAIISPTLP